MLILAAPVFSQVATPPDLDADLVPDYCDRCLQVANPRQVDSDGDGLGNACDCDFDGNGNCSIADFNIFLPDFQSGQDGGQGTDMDTDGAVSIADFTLFLQGFIGGSPGPGRAPSPGVGLPGGQGCFDGRWGREPWAVDGAPTGSGLGCEASCARVHESSLPQAVKDAVCPSGPNGGFAAGFDSVRNPTSWAVSNVTAPGQTCPNAAFSTGDPFDPRACDKRDLCVARCGYKTDDCHRELHRDLVETCAALQGAEAATCQSLCNGFAEAFGSFYTGEAAAPIGASPAPWEAADGQDTECGCCPPLCTRDGDCGSQQLCLNGYCAAGRDALASSTCTVDLDCGVGFSCRADPSGANRCFPGSAQLPLPRAGQPHPVCGDGACDPVETCHASGCPEDCGDRTVAFVPGNGRCGTGDSCLTDLDCIAGNCSFEGVCAPAPDGSPCDSDGDCESLICAGGACQVTPTTNGAVCGDGTCEKSYPDYESDYSCPQDCASCGDNRCSSTESCSTCPSDCGFCGGEPCFADFQCVSEYCDSQSDTCSNGQLGYFPDPCNKDSQCGSGTCTWSLFVAGGRCAPVCGDTNCETTFLFETCENCSADCGSCGEPGQSCGSDSDCQAGTCNAGLCEGSCNDGVCTTLPDAESCYANSCQEDCGSCSDGTLCGENADCASGFCSGTPGLCLSEETVSDGDPCLADAECVSGVCQFVCLTVDDLDPGDVCLRNEECKSDVCDRGFCQGTCGDGVCTVLPDGETCLDNGCQLDCGGCPNGTPCGLDADCGSGVCSGVCLTSGTLADGAACLDPRECQSGLCALVCLSAGVLAPGDPCLQDGECTSGICSLGFCDGSCGDGFCTAFPTGESCYSNSCQTDCGGCPNGTPCGLNADCASGFCTVGFCSPKCGNLVCDAGETCSNCGIDCGVCPFCGDLTCGAGENCSNCGIDCGVCQFCGDLSCNNGETCSTCSFDCGACCRGFTAACSSNSQCCSNRCVTDIFGNKSCGL